ncbi:MAG TPA: hypothetical protein VGL72_08480 [Bryobacteraceae bacterium]
MKYLFALILVLYGAARAQVCAPLAALQPNAQLTGTLDPTLCTLSDGTLYADYLLVLPTRGLWTASVIPADGATPFTATLRDPSGALLASGPSINRTIERGSYHVIINAPQAGGFTLTSQFTAAPNILCRQFPLLGVVRSHSGILGSGSCTLPDSSVYDGYQITLFGTGTLDVAINTSAFTPLPILRTSDGYAIAGTSSVDANGVFHLTIPEVGSDTYALIVAVSSPDQSGGAYSVSAAFVPDPTETCLIQAALTASQQATGSISAGSCNFNLPARDDSAPFNYYTVHLDSPGLVQSSIDSADFSPLLLLLDADGNSIADDIESGGPGMPLIREQLPAGDYLLILYNEDSFGGNYTLDYQYSPGSAPACAVAPLTSGNQATGILSGAASCKDAAFLADAYQIVLPSDGNVSLLVSSPDFSTFVDLHDAKDSDLTWGTQSSDGSTSLLSADLPAGTYYVYAATMDRPGGYVLSYTFTPKYLTPCPGPAPMQDNEYIQNAQLSSSSCEGPDGRFSDSYTFSIPASASGTEAIVMTSDTVVPQITLAGSGGNALRTDQNSYADGNAILVQYLPAGTYSVRARSADPTVFGSYSLYLLFAPGSPQLCAPLALPSSGTLTAQTSFTSCAWYDNTFADVYQLIVTGVTQSVVISAQSNAFDPFLILTDNKGNILVSDDNSGGVNRPLLVQSLEPGVYFVVIKPAEDPTSAGPYTLTTSSQLASLSRRRSTN